MITYDRLFIGGVWTEPSDPELLDILSAVALLAQKVSKESSPPSSVSSSTERQGAARLTTAP